MALAQQFLRTVEVGEHAVEKMGALANSLAKGYKLVGSDQHRQSIEFPSALAGLAIAGSVVGHAMVSHQLANLIASLTKVRSSEQIRQ
jgi:hypothetical protein